MYYRFEYCKSKGITTLCNSYCVLMLRFIHQFKNLNLYHYCTIPSESILHYFSTNITQPITDPRHLIQLNTFSKYIDSSTNYSNNKHIWYPLQDILVENYQLCSNDKKTQFYASDTTLLKKTKYAYPNYFDIYKHPGNIGTDFMNSINSVYSTNVNSIRVMLGIPCDYALYNSIGNNISPGYSLNTNHFDISCPEYQLNKIDIFTLFENNYFELRQADQIKMNATYDKLHAYSLNDTCDSTNTPSKEECLIVLYKVLNTIFYPLVALNQCEQEDLLSMFPIKKGLNPHSDLTSNMYLFLDNFEQVYSIDGNIKDYIKVKHKSEKKIGGKWSQTNKIQFNSVFNQPSVQQMKSKFQVSNSDATAFSCYISAAILVYFNIPFKYQYVSTEIESKPCNLFIEPQFPPLLYPYSHISAKTYLIHTKNIIQTIPSYSLNTK